MPVPPDPLPGLKRTPHFPPGKSFPNVSNCVSEHALNSIPILMSSSKFSGSSCDDREIELGATPALKGEECQSYDKSISYIPIGLINSYELT